MDRWSSFLMEIFSTGGTRTGFKFIYNWNAILVKPNRNFNGDWQADSPMHRKGNIVESMQLWKWTMRANVSCLPAEVLANAALASGPSFPYSSQGPGRSLAAYLCGLLFLWKLPNSDFLTTNLFLLCLSLHHISTVSGGIGSGQILDGVRGTVPILGGFRYTRVGFAITKLYAKWTPYIYPKLIFPSVGTSNPVPKLDSIVTVIFPGL